MQFELLSAKHSQLESKNGATSMKTYKKGDRVKSDNDLEAMFPNKFRNLDPTGPKATADEDQGKTLEDHAKAMQVIHARKVAAKKEKGEAEEETEVVSSLGTDVTDDFDKAKELGFHVFKNGKEYFVADSDDLNTAMNEEPLAKKKVNDFLDGYESKKE